MENLREIWSACNPGLNHHASWIRYVQMLIVIPGNADLGLALIIHEYIELDGAAADLTVFDIGLPFDRTIDFDRDGFPAIRAADPNLFQVVQGNPRRRNRVRSGAG